MATRTLITDRGVLSSVAGFGPIEAHADQTAGPIRVLRLKVGEAGSRSHLRKEAIRDSTVNSAYDRLLFPGDIAIRAVVQAIRDLTCVFAEGGRLKSHRGQRFVESDARIRLPDLFSGDLDTDVSAAVFDLNRFQLSASEGFDKPEAQVRVCGGLLAARIGGRIDRPDITRTASIAALLFPDHQAGLFQAVEVKPDPIRVEPEFRSQGAGGRGAADLGEETEEPGASWLCENLIFCG